MEQKLFTELRPLYMTSKENPNEIRIRIRMRDLIDSDVLHHAVDFTMERYPYFCVELQKKDEQYVFAENHRPVVITNSLHGVDLNTEDSNYHMVAFSFQDNWIILDVFHGMTDGTGAYEVLRTLLYYYCSERYHVKLNGEGRQRKFTVGIEKARIAKILKKLSRFVIYYNPIIKAVSNMRNLSFKPCIFLS